MIAICKWPLAVELLGRVPWIKQLFECRLTDTVLNDKKT